MRFRRPKVASLVAYHSFVVVAHRRSDFHETIQAARSVVSHTHHRCNLGQALDHVR